MLVHPTAAGPGDQVGGGGGAINTSLIGSGGGGGGGGNKYLPKLREYHHQVKAGISIVQKRAVIH